MKTPTKILVIDVGGTHIKVLASGKSEPCKFDSGPKMTARQMVKGAKKITRGWKYDAVSIGYPGPVASGRPLPYPANLGKGWVGFALRTAFGCPVRLVTDAMMHALGG